MWHPWGPSFGAVGKRQGEGWRGAVGFGGQQRQARAPAWPTLAAWGAMESSRGLPRYRPPPILESAEAPATQSEGGDTLSQGKALHLRLVGPLWDSQWVG